MTNETSEKRIYEEAKKRVEAKKGFRNHAIVYVVVNSFLALIWWLTGAEFPWFVFPLGGWGIGLLFHGLGVYVFSGQGDRKAIEREAEEIRRSESRYPEEEEQKREKEEEEEEQKREKEEEEEEQKREKEEEEEEQKREKEEEEEEQKREKEEEEQV